MDINGNMEIENYEMFIDNVSEGNNVDIKPSGVTKDMALYAIKNNINENRKLNMSVDLAIYDLLLNDLLQFSNNNLRDR